MRSPGSPLLVARPAAISPRVRVKNAVNHGRSHRTVAASGSWRAAMAARRPRSATSPSRDPGPMTAWPMPSTIAAKPALRDRRAGAPAAAGGLQFAAQRAPSIPPPSSPPRGSTRWAIRRSEDSFVDELFAPVGRARRAAAQGEFPARLARRESRALRARPADVRRPAADLRQYPLGARRRRPRHHRAHRLRERGDLRRPALRRGGAARGSTGSTSPTMPALGQLLSRTRAGSASPS